MNAPVEAGLQPLVLADSADGICTLTLNRGERFNSLSTSMIAALDAALDTIASDASVRVVVLAGAGRAFCAGHDLNEMRAHIDHDWQRGLFEACTQMMLKLTRIPQPVIARVHGAAAAAGCQLVSMCDLAVAADSAKFGLSGINAGIFCSTPAVGVGRNIGRKRALELLFTGRADRRADRARLGPRQPRRAGYGDRRRGAHAGVGDRGQESRRGGARQARVLRADRSGSRRRVCAGRRNDGVQHARARRGRRHRCLPRKTPAALAIAVRFA